MDGKALAATVRGEVARDVAALGVPVGLATVLVGDDPASAIYVRMKREACAEAGIESIHHELSADTSEADLLALVADLNADPRVTGILTQLPLPEQIDEDRVINAIDPMKDVDGFHPANAGFLLQGRPTLVAATPSGVMEILRHYEVELEGARAVVVGRSNIVGKPMALLLLAENATVTLAHSRTRDLGALVREADVVVAAVGRAGMITAEMVRPGATVIDVGINRVDGKVVGDVAEDVREVAGLLTPVPGGVGPDDDRGPFAQHGSCRSLPVRGSCLSAALGAKVGLVASSKTAPFPGVVRVLKEERWQRAPSSGSRTKRATASFRARAGTTCSSTIRRSRWTATGRSKKDRRWSSRSRKARRVSRHERPHASVTGDLLVTTLAGPQQGPVLLLPLIDWEAKWRSPETTYCT